MNYTSYVLIAVLVPLVLKFLGKSRSAVINDEGFTCMKVSKGYVYLGKLGLIIWSLVYIIFLLDTIFDFSWTKNPSTLGDYMVSSIIFLILIGLSVILIGYGKYVVLYNETKIIFRGLLGKVIEINWKDITQVSFSKIALQFYISDMNDRIYVHKHLSGFNSFTEQLKSKVDTALIQKALVDLEKTRGR